MIDCKEMEELRSKADVICKRGERGVYGVTVEAWEYWDAVMSITFTDWQILGEVVEAAMWWKEVEWTYTDLIEAGLLKEAGFEEILDICKHACESLSNALANLESK